MVEIRAGKGKPMNRNKLWLGILSPLFFWALSVQTGCKLKDNGNEPAPTLATDVYVAGYTFFPRTPCYWKNGIRSDLTCPAGFRGWAYSLSVAGGSVYIAGVLVNTLNDARVPCYWEDGTCFELPVLNELKFAYAQSIYVVGGDVFVCGGHDSIPCYWKNGTRVDLAVMPDMPDGDTSCIYVAGSDVYVSGSLEASTKIAGGFTPHRAGYWKNGDFISVAEGGYATGYSIKSLAVSGSDLYLAGTIVSAGHGASPCLWKNGREIHLNIFYSAEWEGGAAAVCIFGDRAFVAGDVSKADSPVNIPCIWKGYVRTDLPVLDPSQYGGWCLSMTVFEHDVYAAGTTSDGKGVFKPCYWKNGTRTDLSAPDAANNGFACSIFVAKD
jgi:hypothetical protein